MLIKEYGKRVAINRDHLLAGAILHDVGKLFEYRREAGKFVKSREGELLRHPISGAAFAGGFLWQFSPTVNLLAATVCGLLGTLYFAIRGRDLNRFAA